MSKEWFVSILKCVMYILEYLVVKSIGVSFVYDCLIRMKGLATAENAEALYELTVIYGLYVGSIMVLITFYVLYKTRTDIFYKLDTTMSIRSYVRFTSYGILCNAFVTALMAIFIHNTEQVGNAATQTILSYNYTDIVTVLVASGILAPIAEEVVYRWFVQGTLRTVMSAFPAILITSIVFGVMHANTVQGLYAMFFGVVFGYINEYYKSVVPSMCIHMAVNISSIILSQTEANPVVVLFAFGIMLYTLSTMFEFPKGDNLR